MPRIATARAQRKQPRTSSIRFHGAPIRLRRVARELLLIFDGMKCIAALALVAFCGCASRTLPYSNVVKAQGTISAAEALGAGKHPQASEHVGLARQEIERAKQLARDGKAREGRLVLRGAQADAELGIMIVRAEQARAELRTELSTEAEKSSQLP